ncbi:hypothetical protein EJF36_06830 [Bacillus sp. HMF5848]|uniref:hypothetical protein n=1 Tax=Bacillus sp. HMF5848 TaxID=2495421 RepID=UPI000F77DBDD|nr:hypothetical protein [Bacillus sp. HMF5848]RSK26594.1 hypothetical protein EJF36_06830 [Bacillus sp. HMF5848]
MINRHHQISIKTITDYHLESFIRCPYKFYYQHVLSVPGSQIHWKQVVQYILNKIVQGFYQLPNSEQSKLSILKLIDSYWQHIDIQLFESKIQYYTVLAKTTDYLLQFLTPRKTNEKPLFLYEKLNTYVDELETQLSVTLELGEWSRESFTVKKYLLEADDELVKLYNYLIIVFSKQAFGKLPEKIEIVNLMKGEVYTYTPMIADVTQGMLFLKYIKSQLQDPDDYTKTNSLTECNNCPFTQSCYSDIKKKDKRSKLFH